MRGVPAHALCPCQGPSSASHPAGWGIIWVKPTLPVLSSLSKGNSCFCLGLRSSQEHTAAINKSEAKQIVLTQGKKPPRLGLEGQRKSCALFKLGLTRLKCIKNSSRGLEMCWERWMDAWAGSLTPLVRGLLLVLIQTNF